MNSALLLSNAIALAVLVGFHFVPESGAVQVAQRMPHYLQLQRAPQLAVMSDQRSFISQEVSQEGILLPLSLQNAWYFESPHQEHSMSKSAAGFLILALLSGILHLSLVQETVVTLPLIACGVFGALFVLALIAGRKIKFDPVLR